MELEILPRWDLSDLYSGPEAAELADDFNRVSAAAIKFKNDYCGKVASLSAAELSDAVRHYEATEDFNGSLEPLMQSYDTILEKDLSEFENLIAELEIPSVSV